MSDKTKALGTESIRRLIVRLATPSIVSLGVLAFYNVVDAIFVGHGAGTLAIAGIGVAFPLFLLILGIGQLVGVGSASLLSRALGRGDKPLAERTLGNALILGLIVSLIMGVFGNLFRVTLVNFAGATPDVLPHALAYIDVILGGSFTIVLSSILLANLRAQGDAIRATTPMIVGGILNILLDPIFIFGLRMGTAGAAWATVISSGVSFGYYLYAVVRRKAPVRLRFGNLILRAHTVWSILSIGASSFVGIFASSVATVVVNRALAAYGGGLPIAIYSVVNRIVMFSRMPVFGVSDGSQPIYGYNYGAGNYARVIATLRYALGIAVSLASLFWGLFLLLPRAFLAVFSSDPSLITQGARALRIIVLAIPLLTLQAIVGGFYQALGRAAHALAISLLRDILLIIPAVLILSSFFRTTGVWMAFPIADSVSALVVSPMLVYEVRKLRRLKPGTMTPAPN
jgi:putative MATE family efflux protein